ncbi:MAG: 50S ribosomal protein L10 [Patescibacteria group bacterium]|nr:MAG: 50S ribosomal protein L10 [Patescibacteria group bacterium]
MVNQLKKQKVQQLTELISTAENFFLIKVGNIKHQQLEKIRKDINQYSAKIKFLKNSLFEKTINKLSSSKAEFREFRQKVFPLKENTAVVLDGTDIYEVLKKISEYAKDYEELQFKGGYIDSTVYDSQNLDRLSKLPSKQELLSKIYLSIKSPVSRLHTALQFNTTKVYLIIKELAKKQAN